MQTNTPLAPDIVVTEKKVKGILSDSKVHTYALNAYVGCQHACSYCYARFMKKYSRHDEPWGHFVDVKINAPDLLKREVAKKNKGKVWISGTCDPYQPVEEKYQLTRDCLRVFAKEDWPVVVQTRSPLAIRDLDLFTKFTNIEIGFSIPTCNDRVREIFEPAAPPIHKRIAALKELKDAGIKTYAMLAPIFPRTESLVQSLDGLVDYIIVDKLNYNYADHIFKRLKREQYLKKEYFVQTAQQIKADAKRLGIDCRIVF